MSLLGFLAAGAGQAYAQQRQVEVAQEREFQARIFSAEIQAMYQERLAERQMGMQIMHEQIKRENEAKKLAMQHGLKMEEIGAKTEGRMAVEGFKAGEAMKRVGAAQSGAMTRAQMAMEREKFSQTESNKRLERELAAGKYAGKGAAKSEGEMSVKDMRGMMEKNSSTIDKLKKELSSPRQQVEPDANLMKQNTDQIRKLEEQNKKLKLHLGARVIQLP